MNNILSDVGLITIFTLVLFVIKKVYDYFYFKELLEGEVGEDYEFWLYDDLEYSAGSESKTLMRE